MAKIIPISESEYKKHMSDIGVPRKQIDDMWEKVLIERKKYKYNENRKRKK